MTPAERNRIRVDHRAKPQGWWHPEAKRMRADGASFSAIGRYFNVSYSAVKFAVDDEAREAQRVRNSICRARRAAKAVPA